jgi:hypothetical protein
MGLFGIVFRERDHIFTFVSQTDLLCGVFFVYTKRKFNYRSHVQYCLHTVTFKELCCRELSGMSRY